MKRVQYFNKNVLYYFEFKIDFKQSVTFQYFYNRNKKTKEKERDNFVFI